ncbi:hypothetical protein [Paenibacillus sp. PDC88]|uniref:hypothetical protein n=1 Tax=Paenibacillus sp. PDC88 TaxID=1884375 RepID=UPI000894ACFD|nr:hypothetical protein [Paenibacillus sp. PDC88]SDX41411.1 hypothetical protein SAMN05518848_10767 [Paenibacillus sp. PDC88]
MAESASFTLEDISFEIVKTEESSFKSGDSGFIIYFKIFNSGKKSMKIKFKEISYVKKDKEQTEVDNFLNGLLSREGAIKSDSYKNAGLIFYKSHLDTIRSGDSLFIELLDEQRGKSYDLRFRAKKKNQITVEWVAQKIDVIEIEKSITPIQIQTKLKKNLQRLEPLEERLGVYFDNLSVKISSDFNIKVLGEIFASNGSTISESINITLIIYDVDGNVIGTEEKSIYCDDFYGFDVFELVVYEEDIALKADKIRLFPKKR